MARLGAALVVVAVLGGACASGPPPEAARGPTTAPGPTAGPPAGEATCPAPGSVTVPVDGVDRRSLLAVPPGGAPPFPLVVNLHGLGSSAAAQAAYTGLVTAGTGAGFVVATPDGTGQPRRWDVDPDGPDARFIAALVDLLAGSGCVRSDAVFATGMSNGAALASVLGCGTTLRLVAVAPVAAVVAPPTCPEPPSVLAIHGTADEVVPYGGGPVQAPGPFFGVEVPPVPETMDAWAALAGCRGDPVDAGAPGHPDVTRRTWSGCRDGRVVELITVEGGGHTWPGAPALDRLGPTSELPATTTIVSWFRERLG